MVLVHLQMMLTPLKTVSVQLVHTGFTENSFAVKNIALLCLNTSISELTLSLKAVKGTKERL